VTIHSGLADGRWLTMTLAEQLGNAGADVGRAIRAKANGDSRRLDAALDRALELLDLTISDPKLSPPRRQEVARAREVVCDYLVGDNVFGSTDANLDAWFTSFAMAARRDR
jgi:hypothetical protein